MTREQMLQTHWVVDLCGDTWMHVPLDGSPEDTSIAMVAPSQFNELCDESQTKHLNPAPELWKFSGLIRFGIEHGFFDGARMPPGNNIEWEDAA